MNQIVRSIVDGEVLSSRDTVRVLAYPHPLQARRVELQVPAGLSVAEIFEEIRSATRLPHLVLAVIGTQDREWPVPQEDWHRVRPKAGTTIAFKAMLQGSGALRIILTLAIAVAAAYTGGAAAGLFFTAGSLAFTAASAAISAGLVIGGTIALNALFPTRPADLSSSEGFTQLASIQGAQNQAQPYEAIPVVLGLHRLSPFYAAKPYTELIGDDQYLRLLFCWGYGPLDLNVETFKIGETLLSSFSNYEIENRQGFDSDDPITLYPSEVDEQVLAVELTSVAGVGGVDSIRSLSDGEIVWTTRTTAANCDFISVDYTFPDGVFATDGNGNPTGHFSAAKSQYRLTGTSNAWVNLGAGASIVRAVKTARRGIGLAVTRGQYDVRTGKASNTFSADVKFKDKVIWTALRSFTNDNPIAFAKPLALTALRIKATDQLNGVIDTFNGVPQSLATAFNGSTWAADTATNNPADLFRLALQGPANARPVADAQVDLLNLQDWWSYCVSQGFTFNQVRGRSSVYDTLADIAAAGRAVPTFIDGKWGVIWDRPSDPVVQHFTPRNSWNFSGTRPYARLPDAWRVRFINANNGYTDDERIVYDDGFDSSNATQFESLEFPGVTDPDLIWKHGRFHIAQARLRPEKFTISTDWEHLRATRGDRVHLAHDVVLIGLASGLVKTVAWPVITVDELVTLVSGTTYALRFRLSDGTSVERAVSFDSPPGSGAGDTKTLTLVGTLPASVDVNLLAGDLFSFGVTSQETAIYRIYGIAHQQDLVAQLTLVDDAAAIATADTGPIPAYNPNITIPPDPFTLPPQDLTYIEVIEGYGPNQQALTRLSWRAPQRGEAASYDVQERDDNGDALWRDVVSVLAPTTTINLPIVNAGVWSYRVRAVFKTGDPSNWVALNALNLVGLLSVPDDVANFRATFISGRSYLAWDAVADPRRLFYEVRKGAGWDAALNVGDAISEQRFQTVGDDTYLIAGYVVTPFGTRVYSAAKAALVISGSVLTENVVISYDERANAWPGIFTGTIGKDESQNFIRTSGTDNFLVNPDVLGTGSILDAGGQGGGTYISAQVADAGRISRCRVSVDYQATGVPAAGDFLGDPDLLGDPDFLQSYLTQLIRVYPIIRVAQAGGSSSDVFAPADIFDLPDVFAPDIGVTWADWQKWSPDVYVGWLFQLGLVFEILDPVVGAIAYALKFNWTVDVPDRLDRYQNLAIPAGGLAIAFEFGGYDTTPSGDTTPFGGGPNNATVPHITSTLLNPTGDLRVVVDPASISKSGCTAYVRNAIGGNVGGTGVNIFAQGF